MGENRNRRSLAAVVALLICCQAVPNAETPARKVPQHFKVIELPFRAFRINEHGVVAGITRDYKLAIWSESGGVQVLGTLPGFAQMQVTGINNSGHVIGLAATPNNDRTQSYIYRDGKLSPITELAKANAINDAEDIAGEGPVPGKPGHNPVVLRKGKIIDLGGCCGGAAASINNEGKVVGIVYDKGGRYHAFSWTQSDGMKDIDAPQLFSAGIAVTGNGDMLVQEFERGYYLYAGTERTKVVLKRGPNDARALNDSDFVVGGHGPPDVRRAFIWSTDTGVQDLNDLIPAGEHWRLENAAAITSKNEIVGWGDHQGKEDVGYVLIPE